MFKQYSAVGHCIVESAKPRLGDRDLLSKTVLLQIKTKMGRGNQELGGCPERAVTGGTEPNYLAFSCKRMPSRQGSAGRREEFQWGLRRCTRQKAPRRALLQRKVLVQSKRTAEKREGGIERGGSGRRSRRSKDPMNKLVKWGWPMEKRKLTEAGRKKSPGTGPAGCFPISNEH